MKKSIILIGILFLANSIYGQKNKIKCKNCKDEIQDKFLNTYTSEKKDIIEENWSEYFGENLFEKIPSKSLPKNVYALKFDALGCIYPKDFNENSFKMLFAKGKRRINYRTNEYLYKNTFYKLPSETITNYKNKYSFKDTIKAEILNSVIFTPNDRSLPDDEMYIFRKDWNENFGIKHINKINQIIEDKKIKKVVYVVHGYNLPYSLAHIQFNNIVDLYKDSNQDLDEILFIATYWPSTNRKKSNYKNGSFYFRNKLNYKSISGFPLIINRSFLTGLGIRQILNGMKDFDGEVHMISHSMGGPTISAALINPIEKLKSNRFEKLTIKKENSKGLKSQLIAEKINSLQNTKNYNKLNLLKNEFYNTKIEEYKFSKLKVYLNAPAMSGLSTFKAPDLNETSKASWTIAYNNTDKVLHKTFGPIRFGDQNGDTRLGGNWENEAWKTKDQLRKYKLEDRFKFVESGVQVDLFGHDFFCYLNQPLFQKHLKDFITEN
jgi:hypothetical protein